MGGGTSIPLGNIANKVDLYTLTFSKKGADAYTNCPYFDANGELEFTAPCDMAIFIVAQNDATYTSTVNYEIKVDGTSIFIRKDAANDRYRYCVSNNFIIKAGQVVNFKINDTSTKMYLDAARSYYIAL